MVKNILFRYGFGVAKIIFKAYPSWTTKYKSIFEIEKYLLILDIRKYRVALSKFRCVNHKLNVEIGRQCNTCLK